MLNTTTAAKISLACSTMSAMLIGFLGNSIIIFLFVFNKGLRNGTNMQLVNVAACYMTTAVLHMPACLISISSGPHPPFSPLFCKLLQFTNDLIYIQICFATCALAFYQCFSIKPFLTLKRSNSGSQTAVVNNNRLKYLLCLITWVLSTGASVTSQLFNADCSDVFARYSNFIISWSVFIGMFVLCSFITLGFLVMTYSRISRARSLLPQRMKMVDTVKATCTLDRFSKSVTTSLIIFVQSFFCSTPLAVYRVFAGRHIIENRYFYSLCLVQLFFMQVKAPTFLIIPYQIPSPMYKNY
ncbi:probable G-protein coupled receptor 63 [Symsagittifera roscoffensis]|uniref:probable G-protein coupled receptor 63 n=1 Tax=Symsagittifera roscoffensis TaxID=84072 RepID=UPI00307BB3CF